MSTVRVAMVSEDAQKAQGLPALQAERLGAPGQVRHSPKPSAGRTYLDEAWAFDRVERALRQYQSNATQLYAVYDEAAIIDARTWLRERAGVYRALAQKARDNATS